jgi:pimeloyl-ACP methyl ester carboxylesterase
MDFDYVLIPSLVVLTGGLVAWLSIRCLLRLRGKSYAVWRRVAQRTALSLAALVAVALAASSGFNAIALYRGRYRPPGLIYLVNGARMRIDCTGDGSPTLILDTGAGGDGLEWGGVQPALSKTTRVCSYDRAGMGWSDPLPPPRDAVHVANELHGLLIAAKINGPTVLMGHSRGGIFVREYASSYSAQVVGLVLVDSHIPLMEQNPVIKRYDEKAERNSRLEVLFDRIGLILGIPRLLGLCSGPIRGYDAHTAQLFAEDRCHQPYQAMAAEDNSLLRSDQEAAHTVSYGSLPILILSSDIAMQAAHGMPLDLLKIGDQMQEDLKKLSSRGRRIIAKGSGHFIPQSRPDLVVKQVSLFIEQIRGTTPGPAEYGTTVTE